jgi:hypothetical protein
MLMLVAVAVGGCGHAADGPVLLQTHPVLAVCPAARVGGVLVADPNYGLAFNHGGDVQGVIWPQGYTARREYGVVVLIDPSDRTVAREGDQIVSAGSSGEDGVALPCGDLEVNPSGH